MSSEYRPDVILGSGWPYHNFTEAGRHKEALDGADSPPLTDAYLRQHFVTAASIEGDVGATGVVVKDDAGNIVGAAPSPDWAPDGVQRESQVVPWNIRDLGIDFEAGVAVYLIERAERGWNIGSTGSEREAWWIRDHRLGQLALVAPDLQIETHRGMLEEVQRPDQQPWIHARRTAEHLWQTFDANPGFLLSETPTPPVGSPADPGFSINNGRHAVYIATVHTKLKALANARDPYAAQLIDYLAQAHKWTRPSGRAQRYRSFEDMRDDLPDVRYWSSAARHRSHQLPHVLVEGEPNPVVPSRIACAAGDMNACSMAAMAKLLSFGSPMLFGQSPAIWTPDGVRQPRDYRAILQLTLDTAYPGELVGDPATLNERITRGMIDGHIPTPARGAYIDPQTGVYTYHGDVRIRGDSSATAGRIENTAMGPTQWPDDEWACDVLIDLLNISALEAVSQKQTVAEYFKDAYGGLLAGNKDRLAIVTGYNLDGRDSPLARAAIEQCVAYIEDMGRKYPGHARMCRFAARRFANLLEPPVVDNIANYYYKPKGCFAEVVQLALQARGARPIDIERQKCKLQRDMYEWRRGETY